MRSGSSIDKSGNVESWVPGQRIPIILVYIDCKMECPSGSTIVGGECQSDVIIKNTITTLKTWELTSLYRPSNIV
jgi:hypothetical protein